MRSDWEFYANVLKLAHWGNKVNCCFLCLASIANVALKYSDFGPRAGWRNTRRTHASWKAELLAAGLDMSVLFQVCLGLSLACVMIDTLHTIDLGITSHVVGNIIMLIAQRRCGGTIEERVSKPGEQLEEWCREKKCGSILRGRLTYARIRSQSGLPKLKGKAMSVRKLLEWAHEKAKEEGLEVQVIALAQLLIEFYDKITEEPLHMSEAACNRIREIGNLFCNI